MQNYELFWNNQLIGETQVQLVIDWDTFITSFVENISKYAQYELNNIQKQFIKSKIDPEHRNEIYKSGFLLFAKNYWDLPSNRTNLFKMKMNLTNVIPRLNLMTGLDAQRLNIVIVYKSEGRQIKKSKFEYCQDTIHIIDNQGYTSNEKKVNQNGFISIGSGEFNDIVIKDCLFINKRHLKVISIRGEKTSVKNDYYDMSPRKEEVLPIWFIRDVSRSNRVKYVLDTPYKYVIVKPKMVISLGLTSDFEVHILEIGFNSGEFSVGREEQNQLLQLLNADRINYMGDVDSSVPLKTVLNVNFNQITHNQIENMYTEGRYYPDPDLDLSPTKKSKQGPSLAFQIVNKRTCTSQKYRSNDVTFSIGRATTSTYRIDDIAIRDRECLFQCVNNIWMISNPQPNRSKQIDCNMPSVYLASRGDIQQHRNSNRVPLTEGCPYVLRGVQFELSIELIQPNNECQQ